MRNFISSKSAKIFPNISAKYQDFTIAELLKELVDGFKIYNPKNDSAKYEIAQEWLKKPENNPTIEDLRKVVNNFRNDDFKAKVFEIYFKKNQKKLDIFPREMLDILSGIAYIDDKTRSSIISGWIDSEKNEENKYKNYLEFIKEDKSSWKNNSENIALVFASSSFEPERAVDFCEDFYPNSESYRTGFFREFLFNLEAFKKLSEESRTIFVGRAKKFLEEINGYQEFSETLKYFKTIIILPEIELLEIAGNRARQKYTLIEELTKDKTIADSVDKKYYPLFLELFSLDKTQEIEDFSKRPLIDLFAYYDVHGDFKTFHHLLRPGVMQGIIDKRNSGNSKEEESYLNNFLNEHEEILCDIKDSNLSDISNFTDEFPSTEISNVDCCSPLLQRVKNIFS